MNKRIAKKKWKQMVSRVITDTTKSKLTWPQIIANNWRNDAIKAMQRLYHDMYNYRKMK